jgi:hypothetical protein
LVKQKPSYIVVAPLTRGLKREAVRVEEWRAIDPLYSVGEFRLLGSGEAFCGGAGDAAFAGTKVVRVFVTNRANAAEAIWRDYNPRACVEQRIEELKSDLARDDICRAREMTGYRQPASLGVQVSLCGATLGRAGHRIVLHLSAAWV